MNTRVSLIIAFVCFFTGALFSQNPSSDFYKISTSTAIFTPEEKTDKDLRPPSDDALFFGDQYFKLIQFFELPNSQKRQALAAQGLDLVDYLPKNTYFAVIDKAFDFSTIQDNVRAILEVDERFKLETEIYHKGMPTHAFDENGNLNLIVSYYDAIDVETVMSELRALGEIKEHTDYARQINLTIKPYLFPTIVNLPYVQFIGAPDATPENEATFWQGHGRSNFIGSGHNGLNFNGDGTTICVSEGGYVSLDNLDFKGRLIELVSPGSGSGHKNGVIARAGGAGNINPADAGVAWGADVISSSGTNYSGYYNSYGNLFTNHSYGWGVGGGYNSGARSRDLFVTDYPAGAVAYSAGNNGGSTGYAPYNGFSGWANVTGSTKHSKNNFATASTNTVDNPTGFSSSGPASDGRILPQISIEGGGGTSHAAPKLVGVLGVLSGVYTHYNGVEAPSSILKAVLLNTADDIGNPGIDFKTGYGRVNMRRAHDVIQSGQIITGSVDQAGNNQHIINVPANTEQVRVLVYWRDVAAAVNAATHLVNDIDITLTDLSSTAHLPWVLDHTPDATLLNANATQGADHLNNVEQVTIDAPAAGNYTLDVSGFNIPTGPQEYFVVYEFLEDEIQLTYPINNDHFVSGSNEVIYWDSYGTSTSSFTLQYQLNGGAWQTIGTAAATDRSYTWTPPAVTGGINTMKVRVMRDGMTSESANGTLGERPTNLAIEWACGSEVKLTWSAVDGATAYKIYALGAKHMEAQTGNVTFDGTSAIVTGVSTTETVLFGVSAITGANEGRRTNSISKEVGDFNCFNAATWAPLNVTKTAVTLQGSINPHNATVSNVRFEYGPSTAYGSFSPTISTTATGHDEERVDNSIAYTLAKGDKLHYRMTATVNGTTVYGDDVVAQLAPGNALTSTGTGVVSVQKGDVLNFGSTESFSVSLWVKTSSTSNDAVIITDKDWDSGGNVGWGIFYTGGTWKLNMSDGNGTRYDYNNISTIGDGNWHHLVATFDRSSLMRAYVDGKYIGGNSISGLNNKNIDTPYEVHMMLGVEDDYPLDGQLDEVSIWNRVLSENEIKEMVHQPLVGTETDLLSYWSFDQDNAVLDKKSNTISTYAGTIDAGSTPFGVGETEYITGVGTTANFADADVAFDFTTGETINLIASKIDLAPSDINGVSGTSIVFDEQYWVIHRHNSLAYSVDLTFTLSEDITVADEANPAQVLMYQRVAGSDDVWTLFGTATAASSANETVTFEGITDLNMQFLIARDPSPVISVSKTNLQFDNQKLGCTTQEHTYELGAYNLTNTVTVSATGDYQVSENSGSGFASSVTFSPTNGSVTKTIYVRLNPSSTGTYDGNITHTSNGAGNKSVAIGSAEVVTVTDVAGKAMEFFENADYLTIEDLNWSSPAQYTIEWWINPDTYNNWNQQIGNGWGNFLFHANNNGSVSVGTVNNSSAIITSPILVLNEWQHFAYTFNSGTAKLYWNGIEVGSSTTMGNVNWSTFRIGHTGGHSINGEIDEFRMWTTAKTVQEIRENMHISQTGNEPDLKVYLQFQTSTGNLVDLSQNCYKVSITGGAVRTTSNLAVAGGLAVSKDISAAGMTSFDNGGTDTNVDINFGTSPNGAVVVSHLMAEAPHGTTPGTAYDVNTDYWIVHNYGSTTTGLNADMTFTTPSGYVVNNTAADYELFKRGSLEVGAWDAALNPDAIDETNNALTFNAIDGFSQFILAKNPAAVLPVELVDFNAQLVNKEVLLTWNTSLELNNEGFEIQRLTQDNRWEAIGFVDGKGNTLTGHAYQFIDNDISASTVYFYRLNQLDWDGTATLSDIKSVRTPSNGAVQIAPNPATNELTVSLTDFKGMDAQLQIFNAIGQQVKLIRSLKIEGDEFQQAIDISALPAGNYVLKISNGTELIVQKFVKA